MTHSSGGKTLRADIQGLRAVAVLTVIVSHAGLAVLPGGFVGVDVFFVISGFLITQLLVREVERSGRVSLLQFYARRARRILPAATVVLVATTVASVLWLGAGRAPDVVTDAVWAAFFAVNIRLATQGTDYFAHDLPPSPVQHYWSLAVEEQFYIVWPLAIVATVVIAARHHAARTRVTERPAAPYGRLLVVIGALTGASLTWSILRTSADPTSAYFSSLPRAWELGLGACGAIWLARREHRTPGRPVPRALVEVSAAAGIVAVLVACLVFDESTPIPGWHAALPVLGSLLVLVAGGVGARRSVVDRCLGVRPMALIGDWSYSLYLWHWPLLVVPTQYLDRELRLTETLAVVTLTFGLAWFTYTFVEDPLRNARPIMPSMRAVAVYPVSVALIVGTAWGANAFAARMSTGDAPPVAVADDWRTTHETGDKAVALVRESVRAARRGHGVPAKLRPRLHEVRDSVADQGDCDYSDDAVRQVCVRGDRDAERSIVVFGNSHGRHWISAFDRIGRELGYRTYYFTKVQCVGALVTPDSGTSPEPFTGCVDFHKWALDEIARIRPTLAVVSTSPGSRGVYDDEGNHHTERDVVDDIVLQGYVELLDTLQTMADETVMLLDVPRAERDPVACLGSARATLRRCLTRPDPARDQQIEDQAAAAKKAGVRAVPTRQWFCHRDRCPAVVGDLLPYRDAGHVTNEYAAHLARPLARRLGLSG